ncbi:two-component system response regulator LytT [Breznakia sp. PF5-3]|uniref:LytR/AlgR family response regulator transcription factor n=1 Tax=unclassified Breznakia TaxID=2623764 RepID=UPI0024075AED|nr:MULTISPECIES: LytTR family DNA-binding domain-containing protein [unclassified Breznakia]MDL2276761.1 LytTR family DNA-binding domain-containing protein [Breznakia sp. OttesenSCG-928-G09]MDF9825311.1 two-component system response regulator LytT [Breznakia sp. PM6-1]MDF9836206.1 two-component system response regulator LytT [Breznakia sp. PF5-3]MDF9838435.1 two-component system response regulator LytT [Breznakia sp. PFB2-8]MDF9860451.1 two-component system response regulator LytT [Breznakia s
MIRICLCDDNPAMLDREEKFVRDFEKKHNLNFELTTFPNGEALLFHAEDYYFKYDIIILDILMGDTNGIDVANALRKLGSTAQIIFVTSSREHVFDSFDSNPLHYLLKDDLDSEQAEAVLLKAVELSKKKEPTFVFKKNATMYSIPMREIRYFEIIGRIMTINCKDKVYEYYKRIDDLEKELEPFPFCRIHRSYIVNLEYVKKLSRSELTLTDNTTLAVGKSFYPQITHRLSEYLQSGE